MKNIFTERNKLLVLINKANQTSDKLREKNNDQEKLLNEVLEICDHTLKEKDLSFHAPRAIALIKSHITMNKR